MKLIDLHCDTPYRIYRDKLSFENENLQVSAQRLFAFEEVRQVCAIWCDKALPTKRHTPPSGTCGVPF